MRNINIKLLLLLLCLWPPSAQIKRIWRHVKVKNRLFRSENSMKYYPEILSRGVIFRMLICSIYQNILEYQGETGKKFFRRNSFSSWHCWQPCLSFRARFSRMVSARARIPHLHDLDWSCGTNLGSRDWTIYGRGIIRQTLGCHVGYGFSLWPGHISNHSEND